MPIMVIIGGGFSRHQYRAGTGERGSLMFVVLEARHLGYGGTERNGGQVMAGIGHDIEAVKICRRSGNGDAISSRASAGYYSGANS